MLKDFLSILFVGFPGFVYVLSVLMFFSPFILLVGVSILGLMIIYWGVIILGIGVILLIGIY